MEKRKYSDRAQAIKLAVTKRRRRVRELAVEYLGGKCKYCGYAKCINALDVHHLGNKSFGISAKGYTRSWKAIEQELDKCILVCANCHRELHAGLLQPFGEIQE